jgi:hypothetical protein
MYSSYNAAHYYYRAYRTAPRPCRFSKFQTHFAISLSIPLSILSAIAAHLCEVCSEHYWGTIEEGKTVSLITNVPVEYVRVQNPIQQHTAV